MLKVLKEYGYTGKNDKVYLQCFDANELKRINGELMPAMGMDPAGAANGRDRLERDHGLRRQGRATPLRLRLDVQAGAMKTIATYAEGIGPWKPMVVTEPGTPGKPVSPAW